MFGAVREIVTSMGLGSQVAMAATLVVAAFYVYRAVGMARVVSGVLGTLTREVLVLLVVGAVVIGLGWASPNVGTAIDHAQFALREGVDLASGPGRRLFRWAVDAAAGGGS
ncbi:hypothetical protein [Halorubrum kocurii]|uniref:Uncharacterized protein n=1 Tax=Halorubrum kocurii JCM 14978 TaxID=1230456 RepID=M0NTG5_9EURY|nr:hypothetical protein [Halorubrum kocurii]EMA59920.1 hypothetical protein C468_14048 [Halorubrum kocurii JCM 14978]